MTEAVSCGGVVIHDGKVLLLYKNQNGRYMGWVLPKGTVEPGETYQQTALREVKELGVKYPFASWGNIINDVNNAYVMTNYLFIWIPAGVCLLLTVLGFNFVGDGLRDAFDPKMKR